MTQRREISPEEHHVLLLSSVRKLIELGKIDEAVDLLLEVFDVHSVAREALMSNQEEAMNLYLERLTMVHEDSRRRLKPPSLKNSAGSLCAYFCAKSI